MNKLIKVDGSNHSKYRELLRYNPKNEAQRELYKNLVLALESGFETFYKVPMDPSINKNKIFYCTGQRPATGLKFDKADILAKNFLKENSSRLGEPKEYFAFIGTLMFEILCNSNDINRTWALVNESSSRIAEYSDSHEVKADWCIKRTGGRGYQNYRDLGNTYKILKDENDKYYLGGGNYAKLGVVSPISRIIKVNSVYIDTIRMVATPWIVLTTDKITD